MTREELKHKSTMCGWYWVEDADSVMDAMEKEIENYKSISEKQQKLSMDRWFEIKDLRHNLDDWKAENVALKARIKEFEKQLEDVQNTMATENTDLGMENHKLKERIKELEDELKKEHRVGEYWCAKYWDLRASQPKWISVEERLPEHFGWVIGRNGNGSIFPVWYEPETKGFTFNAIPRTTTHWMPLPQPIKENLITESPKSED